MRQRLMQGSKMAAWRAKHASSEEVDMCSSCFDNTKYSCFKCQIPICNKCSVFEENEDFPGWFAGKSVGYCEPCANENTTEKTFSHAKPREPGSEDSKCSNNEGETIATSKSDLGDLEEELPDASDEEKENKSNKVHKTSGRKSPWSKQQLDDFIDIIVEDEEYKKKLIFRNTKFQRNGELYEKIKQELKQRCAVRNENMSFTVEQLRSKFKKCVGEYKRVALTIQTATGVKRFLDEKGYGTWFNILFALVKTRDSCKPEEAIEPSSVDFVLNEDEDTGDIDTSQEVNQKISLAKCLCQ